MDDNQKIQQLEQQVALVEAKRRALREFMDLARSHEGDLFSWIANRELQDDYPGKELGLTVGMDGKVWFQETDE